MACEEWNGLRSDLRRAGVVGTDDLGRFVSNVAFFGASEFDEKAAMPVLLEALPRLTDAHLVAAVAGHLRRPWARPHAFAPLLDAFRRWAELDQTTAWHLGDALGSAASLAQVTDLISVCQQRQYGTARQMPVAALARFKRSPEVRPVLLQLIHDEDVGLHAMSALRQVLGAADALPHIEEVERSSRGTPLGAQAARQAKKIRKALAKSH